MNLEIIPKLLEKDLKENDLITLLDEKTQIIAEYREKYPELSYQELSEVISLESGYKITKSGVNHHFIKIRELIIPIIIIIVFFFILSLLF